MSDESEKPLPKRKKGPVATKMACQISSDSSEEKGDIRAAFQHNDNQAETETAFQSAIADPGDWFSIDEVTGFQ